MNNLGFKKANILLILCVSILFFSGQIFAQIGGSGSINGTVSDSTGANIPNAIVTVKNVATGVETTRQTSEGGVYVITPLPPGTYTVTVTASGFQKAVQEKVIVDALSAVSVNIAMKVGDVNETVTITAAPPQLNTTDARLGTTIRNELYTNLPLAMGTAVAGSGIGQGPRNPGAFIFLLPGVTEGNRWGQINGAQGFSKEVFVEGVPITDPIQQGEGRTISLGVSVEAVEQFQVETSGTGVEFTGQGAENYTIKSGGNKFHASGFEYLRNTVLNARGFFPPIRPVEKQNEFGFTVSGPIIKDKLFFFSSVDMWRYRVTTASQLVSIPSLKMRQGDFSELTVPIYDPASTVCSGTPTVCTRTQFADPSRATASNPLGLNIIPLNRISPISQFLQAQLPTPTGTGIQNNYLGSVPVGYDNNSINIKIDYKLTANQNISGIYTYGKRSQSNPYRETSTAFPQSALPLPYTDTRFVAEIPKVLQLKHNWSITPNIVNQINFGYNHFFVPITNATSDGNWLTKAGLKGLPAGDASDAFLEATFGGPNAPAGWRALNSRDFEDNNYNYTFQDSLLWISGKHSFRFGFQYQKTFDRVKTNDTGSNFVAGFSNNQTAGFNANSSTLTSTTGNAYASYLLGALNTATVNDDSVVLTTAQFSSFSYWAADDWKVNSKLTLNLGVRYDYMLPYSEKDAFFSYLDPTAPNPAVGGRLGALRFGGNRAPSAISCNCNQIIDTYPYAIGPRVGFAYAWNEKTVIRGGYGIMYARRGAVGGREGARIGTGLTGINANATLSAINAYDPVFLWANGVPAYLKGPIYDQTYQTGFTTSILTQTGAVAAGGAVTFGDPESQPPRYQNWNLSIQRSLTPSMVLTLAYVGSNGKQLAGAGRHVWSNQLDPKYLVLGNLLNSPANTANVAAANLILPGVVLPYPTFSGTIAQMLRPFPQYASVADPYGNVGQVNYHALQTSLQHAMTNGLTFNVNYTFSKALGNIFGIRSAYRGELDKSISNTDMPHVFNAFAAYDLPFGKGRKFNTENKVVDAIIGGWSMSIINRFASGTPLGPFTGTACSVSVMGTCYASFNPAFTGSAQVSDIATAVRNGVAFIDRNAFVNAAAFTYGNTPVMGAYGLRNMALTNTDLSLSRKFQIRENLRFTFGADGFNIFNQTRFGSINTNITSAAFGRPTAQTNLPRVFQFKFRLEM